MILAIAPEDKGSRLDLFVARHLPDLTRSHIQTLNRSGAVLVDGRQEKAGYRLRGEEQIEIHLRPPVQTSLKPAEISLKLLYEDDDLAVVDKPAGLVVHPGAGTGTTLVHGLLFRFGTLSGLGGGARPGIVHRLDKWTSGVLVVARNDWTHAQLSKAFQDRLVEKTYVALVHGKLSKPAGDIALKIGRHSRVRTRMSVQQERGRSALSSYRRIEEIKNFSLLEVRIHTGRTHQIRVHLAAIGHPVVGDEVYGEGRYTEFVRRYGKPGRYFLHASELRFNHPRTGEQVDVRSPLPEELRSLLERIRE